MITRKEKEQKVKEITEDFQQARVIILTDYRGLSVSEIGRLRGELKETGCHYKVVKNKLARLAVEEAGYAELESHLQGPTAIAYGFEEDPVAPAKILSKWEKEVDALTIKIGSLGGKLLSPEDVKALGQIPSKEILLARVCGGFQAPIFNLVSVMQGNIRKLVYVLDAVRKVQEA